MAFLAPIVILLLFIPILFNNVGAALKIGVAVQFISIASASYFNLKHMIIPDVMFGIISSIRPYNALALALELLFALELFASNIGLNIIGAILALTIAIVYALIVPIMKKGVAKWTR